MDNKFTNDCGYIQDYINNTVTNGRLMNVIDGDTTVCILPITIGESECFLKFNCRLNGIDTYEMHSTDPHLRELAIKGKNFVIYTLTGQQNINPKDLKQYLVNNIVFIKLKCYKLDKYGRLLVDILLDNDNTLSQELINNNLGYIYHGDKKKYN